MRLPAILLALLSCATLAFAAEESPAPEPTREQRIEAYQQMVAETLKGVQYQEGSVGLPGGIATLKLPDGYRFINGAAAKKVLIDLWGNPPDSIDDQVLGMVVPRGMDFAMLDSWSIVVSYEDSGNVSDKDADEINYDKLLDQMKEENAAHAKAEKEKGFDIGSLVGWALPPHYDKQRHVLYWAKHYASASGHDTLNYDMRVLGRKGVLSLNAVSSMSQLKTVEAATPEIVTMANYGTGQGYADFNEKTDKASKIGLAGLILGGTAVAAKAGLFKGIIAALIAAKKLVIVGCVAVAGFFKRIFGKKNQA